MPAKPLTPEQKEDARRLKEAFTKFRDRRKAEGLPYTQLALEDELDLKQSAMSQYLNGDIPLNPTALSKFCRLMDEKPEQISPSVYRSGLERSKAIISAMASQEVDVTKQYGPDGPMPNDVMQALADAPADTKRQIETTVRMMLGMAPSRKRKAA